MRSAQVRASNAAIFQYNNWQGRLHKPRNVVSAGQNPLFFRWQRLSSQRAPGPEIVRPKAPRQNGTMTGIPAMRPGSRPITRVFLRPAKMAHRGCAGKCPPPAIQPESMVQFARVYPVSSDPEAAQVAAAPAAADQHPVPESNTRHNTEPFRTNDQLRWEARAWRRLQIRAQPARVGGNLRKFCNYRFHAMALRTRTRS